MSDFKTKIGKITLRDNAVRSMIMNDGLANMVSGLGGGMDQQSYAFYHQRDLSQQQIESSFRTSWISRKAHVIPATDSVRAGWQHKADNLDITKIEKEERRLGLKEKIRRAELLSRLYGGSCIMMGVGNDDPRSPLDPMRVRLGDLKYLHVLSRYQVTVQDLILDPGSPFYGQPSMYYVNAGNGALVEVHPSRIVRFVNSDLSEELLWQNQGWGDPLLLSMWSAIVNADTAQGSFAALLNKAQVDTLSVPNFTQSISTQAGEDAWKKRALYTKMYEGLFAVKLIDSGGGAKGSEGEKWEQFTVNWAGIPDVLMAFLQMVSGATDIPFTRLAGKSPDGQNSTGESDQENYNLVITAGQELSLRPRMEQIFNVLYPSALGTAGGDIWFSFNALKIDSDETKAKNAKARAEASQIYSGTGLVPDEVMQEAVKGQLIESGEYPGIEMAYTNYANGTLTPIIEEEEETPDDPLIPLDENGNPRQARESRLFAANDAITTALIGAGWSGIDAAAEAKRILDSKENGDD